MPSFAPFRGLRYSLSHVGSLDAVVCPPYDVISADDRAALAQRSPYNVVHVEVPDPAEADPYAVAATLLDAWRDGGVLRREAEPAFYGHRMTSVDDAGRTRRSVGVIGALGLEPPGAGILPHEQTVPKARTDRLALLGATGTNVSPIWALTPGTGLAALCGEPAHPAEHATADGVTHELWPITDAEQVAAISAHVGAEPVLVADGHHRYETALAHQAERRATDGPGGHDAVMALVVELDDSQLSVQAIHRVVADVEEEALLAALRRWFDLQATDPVDAGVLVRSEAGGGPTVVTSSGTWLARPSSEVTAAATHDLDSSRLDVALADLAATVSFQHGWRLATAPVASGQATAAILLRPATVDQIAAVSRGGVRMPPKTTFFWPKPRTGLVLRELLA